MIKPPEAHTFWGFMKWANRGQYEELEVGGGEGFCTPWLGWRFGGKMVSWPGFRW